MAKVGKKYIKAKELVDISKSYSVDEAIELLKKTSITKFDSSCEIHVRLGVDTRQADQIVRSTVALPKGSGKSVKVIAFVNEDSVKEALAAGATKAGLDSLIEEVTKGFLDFDVAIATPDAMKSLGKVAKILGTKGLMPNPKAGTVTTTVGKTIEEIIKGRLEIRTDKQGQIHQIFGKVSFSKDDLKVNFLALMKAINDLKPSAVKGVYIKNIGIATSMGPGIRVDVANVLEEIK